MLPNEEEQFEDIRRLLQKSYSGPALSDQFTQRLEERLQTLMPDASQTLAPARPYNRIAHRIGGLTLRQRMALGGIGAVAVLAILLLWLGSAATPLSAMEKMAEAIRQVKSCKCTQIVQEPEVRDEFLKPGEPPPRMERVCTVYWLASGSVRTEDGPALPQSSKGSIQECTGIWTKGKPGINIYPKDKTFFRDQALNEGYGSTGCETLEELGRFSGKADRELGTREINGKKARGFQIDKKKFRVDSMPGTREFWIDAESNLPVLVRDDMKWPDNSDHVLIMKDIQYNIDLDPKLFDITPPEGYTDITRKPENMEEQIPQITKAMKICGEVFEDIYPATHGDLLRASLGGVKAKLISDKSKRSSKLNTTEDPEKIQQDVFFGLDKVFSIMAYNSDPAYYGKTVGPKDKDKVLLRWKLDDGRYEVIYGDLHYETVTAEKLHLLEGK